VAAAVLAEAEAAEALEVSAAAASAAVAAAQDKRVVGVKNVYNKTYRKNADRKIRVFPCYNI